VAYKRAAAAVQRNVSPRSTTDWYNRLRRAPDSPQFAAEIYTSEVSRLRGLEEKLRSQLSYAVTWLPFVIGLLAVSATKHRWVSLGFGVVSGLELLSAYGLSLLGAWSRRLHLVVSESLWESLASPDDLGFRLGAEEMLASEMNISSSLNLQNAVVLAGRSTWLAVGTLGAAGALLLWPK